MIIGHGDIATVLPDRDGFCFFASGVSNSKESRESEYEREEALLLSQQKDHRLVYFSSLAVFLNPTTRYAKHKRHMEELVKKTFPHYTILRIGNISWGNNPHTFINYFKQKKLNGEPFEMWDTYRFVIDKEEFLSWIELIPDWNCEINMSGTRMKVTEIVEKYVK